MYFTVRDKIRIIRIRSYCDPTHSASPVNASLPSTLFPSLGLFAGFRPEVKSPVFCIRIEAKTIPVLLNLALEYDGDIIMQKWQQRGTVCVDMHLSHVRFQFLGTSLLICLVHACVLTGDQYNECLLTL